MKVPRIDPRAPTYTSGRVSAHKHATTAFDNSPAQTVLTIFRTEDNIERFRGLRIKLDTYQILTKVLKLSK